MNYFNIDLLIWYRRLQSGEGEADEASRITIMKSMAQDIIDDLIIADRVPSRGHRLALFDAEVLQRKVHPQRSR